MGRNSTSLGNGIIAELNRALSEGSLDDLGEDDLDEDFEEDEDDLDEDFEEDVEF